MIKSINYQANQIASIEISDASDVQSLGDSYGYGSTARVTGQIGDEYIYTPQGWIKTSSGGGGGALVVEYIQGDENNYINATAKELMDALGEGKLIFLKLNGGGPDVPFISYEIHFISIGIKLTQTGAVTFKSITAGDSSVLVTVWKAATENDKPVADY